ncbi:MAG: ATP-dependent helicase [bacterium]|nr:ATP-dependent helicase [bacterium]
MINYQKELNPEQWAVVQNGNGPCLVLAGAGTGKTRTVVYRVAYLLENGVPPESILLVTFTNKAAKEMLRRVEVLRGSQPKGMLGGTFHHIGNLFLRKYGRQVGISPNFTILDQSDSHNLVSQIIGEMGVAKTDKTFLPRPAVIADFLSFVTNSRRPLPELLEERLPTYASRLPYFEQIARKYETKKRQNNMTDFDDLLSLWHQLLARRLGPRPFADRIKYVLVDEYQDTNHLQGKIVEELARDHHNLLVVGDDAQSIYGFRAAAVENILNFPKIFPDTKIFKLTKNYRSFSSVLDLANSCLKNNWNQFAKDLSGTRGAGVKPELWALPDQASEARFIVDKIMDFREDGENLLESAVLFRAAYQAMELELELQKRGLPYIMRGGVRFFEQAHIKDVVAYLKVLQNPADEVAWLRILKLEQGIGEKGATFVSGAFSKISNFQFPISNKFPISSAANKSVEKIIQRLKKIKEIQSDKIDLVIAFLLDDFYADYAQSVFEDARDRVEDLRQLAEFAKHYKSLNDFLSDATLSEGFRGERTAANEANQDKEYLVLSTIHQAKGLEWKNVFLISLIEGQFPHYKSYKTRNELEEERRLFYVAVTRAKDRLYLTYPVSSGAGLHRPSIFVQELDQDLFDYKNEGDEVIEIEETGW